MITDNLASTLQRSFVYRTPPAANDSGVTLSVQDLTLNKRAGVRGTAAAEVLSSLNLPVPAKPNQSSDEVANTLVLRLSNKEYWLLALNTEAEATVDGLDESELTAKHACFPLFCQHSHAWFVVSGDYLAETFAKICGVDLRESVFPVGSIAQTSVARVNAIVVSHIWQGKKVFSVLSDISSSAYLLDAIQDAMTEFNDK